MENAKKFFEEIIRTDEAQRLFASMEKPATEEQATNAYVEIAAKLGIELTAEDIRAYFAQKKDYGRLDDGELAQVAGGQVEKEDCVSTFRHRENCWYNDACDLLVTPYKTYECHYTSR